jgi:DNA-binding NarL/FixJ family response regulator
MTAPAKRIVLIDDHEMSRRGLQAMLSTTDLVEVVGEAGDCESGLAQVTALRPDIVLLDIRMPGVDGLACLGEIKKLEDPVAVVIVTAHDDRRYVLDAVRRGAAGYLLKDASTSEVLAMIEAVAGGQLAVGPDLLREALSTPPEPTGFESVQARLAHFSLTPRESSVLRLLAEGLTNKEIGGRLSIAEDTVKKHVQNIILKLRAADRTQAAIIAYRQGLLEPLPPV